MSAARELAIVQEHRASELRIVAECPHHDLSVYRAVRDLSDIETCYGNCLACGEWIVQTTWMAARDPRHAVETRPMTDRERDALQRIEDQYRRNQ